MWHLRLAFVLLVVFHLFIVLVNAMAFFVLPFISVILNIPFWFSIFLVVPIQSIILFLSFSRTPCPLTMMENSLRKKLGMKEIGGFVGHYLIKQRWRKKGKHAAESICVRTNS